MMQESDGKAILGWVDKEGFSEEVTLELTPEWQEGANCVKILVQEEHSPRRGRLGHRS